MPPRGGVAGVRGRRGPPPPPPPPPPSESASGRPGGEPRRPSRIGRNTIARTSARYTNPSTSTPPACRALGMQLTISLDGGRPERSERRTANHGPPAARRPASPTRLG